MQHLGTGSQSTHAAELPKGLQGFFSSKPGAARSTCRARGASLWAGTTPHSMGPKGHGEEGANHTSYATGEQPQCYAGGLSPGQSRDPALLHSRREAAQGTKSAHRQALGPHYRRSSQSSHCLSWRDAALRAWDCCSPPGRSSHVGFAVLRADKHFFGNGCPCPNYLKGSCVDEETQWPENGYLQPRHLELLGTLRGTCQP